MKKIKIVLFLIISLISFCCFNNDVYAEEYTCTYTGQITDGTLTIKKNENKWIVTYPTGAVSSIETTNVGNNVFPSSNCEDVFYSVNDDVIKSVEENTVHTNTHLSQYCSRYSDLEQFCSNGTCKITSVPCGSDSETNQYGNCPQELAPIILFLKKVAFNTLRIFVPIILIIMATLDLVKAVMATDEKSMQEAVPRIIRRILAAVFMFLITTIVVIVMNMISNTDVAGQENDWKACWTELD